MAIAEKCTTTDIKWIDVINPSAIEMEKLSQEYNLNEHSVRDCLQPEHLPKYEYDEEFQVNFLILRFYDATADISASRIRDLTNKIAIFFTEQMIITIHVEATPFLDLIAKRATKKNITTIELLSKIIWETLETFEDPANKLSEELDYYESQLMINKSSEDITQALFHIKRHASLSHKVLTLMVEPINHLHAKHGEDSSVRDVYDQHLKMQTLYSQILENVNNLISTSLSFAAQRTNEVVRILTLFSVFFMPLTFIVGIYGMNFEFMPELGKKWGYPAVLILMTVVSVIIFIWFKRKKWL